MSVNSEAAVVKSIKEMQLPDELKWALIIIVGIWSAGALAEAVLGPERIVQLAQEWGLLDARIATGEL